MKNKEAEKKKTRRIRNGKSAFEKKTAKEKLNNSRLFYSYLKGKIKHRATVDPLKRW